jgi:hypothetical protein
LQFRLFELAGPRGGICKSSVPVLYFSFGKRCPQGREEKENWVLIIVQAGRRTKGLAESERKLQSLLCLKNYLIHLSGP